MSSEPAIVVEGIGKRYRFTTRRWAGRFVDAAPEEVDGTHFWALRDVSFSLGSGQTLGLVGRNGAGKSTLLRILARITDPSEGRARITGRVGSLLEVGAGFHPEITGRENIAVMGATLGMRRREIQARFDEIVDFAEVAPFIDRPVKHYSTGMYLRLAFSVAAHLDADVLLLDEALAVGDQRFRERSLAKIRDLASNGRTVIFVSHDAASITRLCERALLLEKGRVMCDGSTEEVMRHYRHVLEPGAVGWVGGPAPDEVVSIRTVTRLDPPSQPQPVGRPLVLAIELHIPEATPPELNLLVELVGTDLWPVTGAGTALDPEPSGRRLVQCSVPTLRLAPSRYTVTVTLREGDRPLQSVSQLCPFEVTGEGFSVPAWTWRYVEDADWSDGWGAAARAVRSSDDQIGN